MYVLRPPSTTVPFFLNWPPNTRTSGDESSSSTRLLTSRPCHACYQPRFKWRSSRQWTPRKIAAAAKTNDFARLKVLSARCDQDVDNSAKTFHAFLTSRVTGPSDSLFLEDHNDMQIRAAAASLDRYFAMRPLMLTASALAELTTFALLSLDFLLLSFCDV